MSKEIKKQNELLEEKIERLEILNKTLANENKLLNNAVEDKEFLYQKLIQEYEEKVTNLNVKLEAIYNTKAYKIYKKIRRIIRRK